MSNLVRDLAPSEHDGARVICEVYASKDSGSLSVVESAESELMAALCVVNAVVGLFCRSVDIEHVGVIASSKELEDAVDIGGADGVIGAKLPESSDWVLDPEPVVEDPAADDNDVTRGVAVGIGATSVGLVLLRLYRSVTCKPFDAP